MHEQQNSLLLFVIELGIITTNFQLESKGCPNYCIGDLKPKSQIVFRSSPSNYAILPLLSNHN